MEFSAQRSHPKPRMIGQMESTQGFEGPQLVKIKKISGFALKKYFLGLFDKTLNIPCEKSQQTCS